MTDHSSRELRPAALRAFVVIAGALALAAGLYGRFKGIGTWSLGVDEFYISRSVDNLLRTGLPAFPCGGYYSRGVLYQYLVAGLRLCGWSPETASRGLSAASSLVVLPAAYLAARRVAGALTGWLVVVLLCLSIWEIEMARFARMYAPFQAVFAWYVVAYLRFTLDRRRAALGWMAVLSVVGVLVWEGGMLLGFANLFALLVVRGGAGADAPGNLGHGREAATSWGWVVVFTLLLVPLYAATRDLRIFADVPAVAGAMPDDDATPLQIIAAWFAPLGEHPLWAGALLLPLALAGLALRWVREFRGRPVVCAGLCVTLACAALHAFTAAAGILVLMLLTRFIGWRELGWRRARSFWAALCGFALVWAALVVVSASTGGGPAPAVGTAPGVGPVPVVVATAGDAATAGALAAGRLDQSELVRQLLDVPDVIDRVLLPWVRTLPILSAGLFAALTYLCWITTARAGGRDALSVLLALVVMLVLAVGAIPTDRIETRYTFFLYPLLLLFGVCAILPLAARLVSRFGNASRLGKTANWLVPTIAPLLCFAATEDFQPRHLRDVDTEAVNFRVGMPPHWAEHFYPRNDIGGAAQWLSAHVRPGDLVVSGVPSLDQYYAPIDYFFLDATDNRYEAYVCPDGRTERWTNRPVLYTAAALEPLLAAHHRIYLSLFGYAEKSLKAAAASAGWSFQRVWTASSRTASVVLIEAPTKERARP